MLTPDQAEKKRQLLLSVAIAALNWDEGADFEWHELIGEGCYQDTIEEVYGVIYPYDDRLTKTDKDLEKEWDNALEQVRKDALALLKFHLENKQ